MGVKKTFSFSDKLDLNKDRELGQKRQLRYESLLSGPKFEFLNMCLLSREAAARAHDTRAAMLYAPI